MSGCLVGLFAPQRAGKTLMACMIATYYAKQGMRVYSNIDSPYFQKFTDLNDLPLDTEPKVLLLDECQSYFDSREWGNKGRGGTLGLWINTLGKTNTLCLLTTIEPSMIELRLRSQLNFIFIARDDGDRFTYKLIDVYRQREKIITLLKTEELFKSVDYDTLQVPDIINIDLKNFGERIKEMNKTTKNNKNNKNNKK